MTDAHILRAGHTSTSRSPRIERL